jgi:predicted Zn-dependent protease
MTAWTGTYFDGRSAARSSVTVRLTAVALQIERSDGGVVSWPYGDIRQTQGAGAGEPARLERGRGQPEVLVVEDPGFLPAIRAIAPHYRRRFTDPARRRARIWAVVGLALAAAAASAATYLWIIPAVAGRMAAFVPVEWEEALGRSVVAQTVDSAAVCPVPEALDRLVARLAATRPGRYTFRLTMVNDSIVNAFAAPGGYIVLHRGLVNLTRTPEELAGVLAHEMQHVLLRHGTQAVLREIPLQLFFAAVTSDAGLGRQVAGAAARVGSLRYGRDAEAAADRAGAAMLRDARVDPAGMVTLFQRLEAREGEVPRIAVYLSTHPRTEARIAELQSLAADAPAPVPLMSAEDWAAIRNACARSR